MPCVRNALAAASPDCPAPMTTTSVTGFMGVTPSVWIRECGGVLDLAALRGGCGRLTGLAGIGAAAALLPMVFGVEGLAVSEHGVDLPGLTVGCALDPELVLLGVAAGGLARGGRGKTGLGQAHLLGLDGAGVRDLYPEVIEAATLTWVLQQNELQRWVGDREVGVAGPDLGWLGAEQLAVEGDGLADVVDVEGELETAGHRGPP